MGLPILFADEDYMAHQLHWRIRQSFYIPIAPRFKKMPVESYAHTSGFVPA